MTRRIGSVMKNYERVKEESRWEYKEMEHSVKREVKRLKKRRMMSCMIAWTKEREKDLYRPARQRDQVKKEVQQVRVIKDRDGNGFKVGLHQVSALSPLLVCYCDGHTER